MEKADIEKIAEAVRSFILNSVNDLLPDYEDDDVSLPLFTEKSVVHGAVDVSRLETKALCLITIGQQTEYDGSDEGIAENVYDTEIDVTFVCAKDKYSVLVSRACRYASALKEAMMRSPTFGGSFTGSGFRSLDIDYDAGAVGGQMTASRVGLTVRANEL